MAAILANMLRAPRKRLHVPASSLPPVVGMLFPPKLCSTLTQPLVGDTFSLSLRNPSLPLELGFLLWAVYTLPELPFKGWRWSWGVELSYSVVSPVKTNVLTWTSLVINLLNKMGKKKRWGLLKRLCYIKGRDQSRQWLGSCGSGIPERINRKWQIRSM